MGAANASSYCPHKERRIFIVDRSATNAINRTVMMKREPPKPVVCSDADR